jgi:hypothetical protein
VTRLPWPRYRHRPGLRRASRYGTWCMCSCGWVSNDQPASSGAMYEFGQHLIEIRREKK